MPVGGNSVAPYALAAFLRRMEPRDVTWRRSVVGEGIDAYSSILTPLLGERDMEVVPVSVPSVRRAGHDP